MKRTIFIFFTILSFFSVRSQTPLTQAVDFTVTTLEGETFTLFDVLSEGKYVFIDFFFTTCPPCQETAPFANEAYEYFGCNGGDVFFISIDTGDSDEECQAFGEMYGVTYPTVSGNDGGGNEVNDMYQIGAYPTYILIAPDGQIVEQDIWPVSSAQVFIDLLETYGLEQQMCSVSTQESHISEGIIELSPNPTTGLIEIASHAHVLSMEVLDVMGRVSLQVEPIDFSMEGLSFTLDISSLPRGTYFLRCETTEGMVIKRIEKVE